jgi:uncharacterized cofD-like protein
MYGRTRIVGIGGGTGLAVLLEGLRRVADGGRRESRAPIEITGIVSVADDGGSTGRLRRVLDIPALGDLRNCIVAMSEGNALWRELFQHRFAEGAELSGHALGNLVMAALVEREGALLPAIEQLARPLRLCGRVLPVSEDAVTLGAELDDGSRVLGESQVTRAARPITRLWLEPDARPAAGVLEAIASADAVVLGPGSLYTSLVPNLLVEGVAEAIRRTGALRVVVCNLMTQPGETDGFDALRHLEVLQAQLGPGAIDIYLGNDRTPRPEVLERYAEAGAEPVFWNQPAIAAAGVLPIVADLAEEGGALNRHDPLKLAEMVVSLARCLRRVPRIAPAVEEGWAPLEQVPVAAAGGGR